MGDEVLKGFLTHSAESVMGTIASLIGHEIKLVWGFKADLKDLNNKLEPLVDMVTMAESSYNAENVVVRKWLERVKALLYDAEDVLDEYNYELLKRKFALNIRSQGDALRPRKFRFKAKLWSLSNSAVFRIGMAHKVKGLKESIRVIYAEADRLGIKPVKLAAGSYATPSCSKEDMLLQLQREQVDCKGLVGRDEDIANLVNLLCDPLIGGGEATYINLVGVYGMAGLGKTALAKCVFETKEVKQNFSERIMVCVSHDFELKDILEDMVQQLFKHKSSLSSNEAIKGKLCEKLDGKKYLLVLDDVWETFTRVWEPLRSVLQAIGGSQGTTILLTSRSKPVLDEFVGITSKVRARFYQLKILVKDDSWILFKEKFGDELFDSERAAIGRKLIKKCDGLPLAIKTLAGLLRSQTSIQAWREIEKSEIWNLGDDNILPSVKLSFKYLPSVWLKKCFAYCAIFKEDETIEKNRLIQLNLTKLKGTLIFRALERVKVEEAKGVRLSSKENIEELRLVWNSIYEAHDYNIEGQKLEALQPHFNLASLEVIGYGCRRMPEWFREMTGHGGAPLSNLALLNLQYCNFHVLPLLNNLVSLKELAIHTCENLTFLPGLEHLRKLVKLKISYCPIQRLPSLKALVALEELEIWSLEMEHLEDMPHLTCLRRLYIGDCTKLKSLPAGIASLPSLQDLRLGPFDKMLDPYPFPTVKDNITTYSRSLSKCLSFLTLDGSSMEKVRSLPDQIQHLHSLTKLEIRNFSVVEELPEWLGNLFCLQSLGLYYLPSLKCMPSQAALRHLQVLNVFCCHLLKETCVKDTGSNWSKIRYIPLINLEGKKIVQEM